MKKEYLKNSWRKLDNTAKIFSLDDKRNTNIFRYSVILKQNVDKDILKKALDKTLGTHLAFKVKLESGLFWNYFEFNSKEPIVEEENKNLCERISTKKNNDYLFKLTYYKKKINLDVFHVLTDGAGAIIFLKSIICNYLDLKYNLLFNENTSSCNISYQDQYLNSYNKDLEVDVESKSAYQIPGKVIRNINNTYHYTIDINELKKVCRKYKVTITEYLTAVYIYAMYLSIYKKDSNKEIIITVPIDLRKYYQVDTLSNFFVCMNINSKILENNLTIFDQILKQVHEEFKKKLNIGKVKSYLTRDVRLGTNIFIRLIPLFMKKLFIKYAVNLFNKSTTSTLSNVGSIDLDDRYKKYIDNIMVLVMPGRVQKIKCTICSFDSKLNVTINSNINDDKFECVFLNLLDTQMNGVKMKIGN